MENKRCALWLYIVFLSFSCSKGNPNQEITDAPQPLLISSSLKDGADDVPIGENTIILQFDQNIVLDQQRGIQLNGQTVEQVYAAFKELKITVHLQGGTRYTLNIPEQTIKGPRGAFAAEIQLSFTTDDFHDPDIGTALVTPNASVQARKVYDFLREKYGVKMISGAMANVNWNSNEAEWVYRHTGKYPALNCFDYLHLYASPADWINYENTQVVEDWWLGRGLVAASWHWNVPAYEGSADYHFYTKDTRFDISKAVISGTNENTIVRADLERMAEHLILLRDKQIPVLWRPLHEASGKWFWWGAKTAEDYRKLWVMMFEVFKEKGLNNLIWIWTSQGDDAAWYPGDDYVDMIGCDLYDKPNAIEIAALYTSLQQKYPNKMLTLSEFGEVANLSTQWNSGAKWSWAMPWYDYDRTKNLSGAEFDKKGHIHADIDYWDRLLADERIITRDEMPDLR